MKKIEFEQLKVLIRKTSLANIAAFTLIISGVVYCAVMGDLEGVKMFGAAGIGYLFKTVKE